MIPIHQITTAAEKALGHFQVSITNYDQTGGGENGISLIQYDSPDDQMSDFSHLLFLFDHFLIIITAYRPCKFLFENVNEADQTLSTWTTPFTELQGGSGSTRCHTRQPHTFPSLSS